jgi:hypothetical protein
MCGLGRTESSQGLIRQVVLVRGGNLVPWFEARKRFKLSHAQTQMARELGMNPRPRVSKYVFGSEIVEYYGPDERPDRAGNHQRGTGI